MTGKGLRVLRRLPAQLPAAWSGRALQPAAAQAHPGWMALPSHRLMQMSWDPRSSSSMSLINYRISTQVDLNLHMNQHATFDFLKGYRVPSGSLGLGDSPMSSPWVQGRYHQPSLLHTPGIHQYLAEALPSQAILACLLGLGSYQALPDPYGAAAVCVTGARRGVVELLEGRPLGDKTWNNPGAC